MGNASSHLFSTRFAIVSDLSAINAERWSIAADACPAGGHVIEVELERALRCVGCRHSQPPGSLWPDDHADRQAPTSSLITNSGAGT